MVTKTTYICELCGKEYTTEAECIKCENSHIRAEEIVEQNFSPRVLLEGRYPKDLIISMANGKKLRYAYEAPIIEETTEA